MVVLEATVEAVRVGASLADWKVGSAREAAGVVAKGRWAVKRVVGWEGVASAAEQLVEAGVVAVAGVVTARDNSRCNRNRAPPSPRN